jgi:hypothetical protein
MPVYIHTYKRLFKKAEILPSMATWMKLEITVLSEISQAQKSKYGMMSLI